MGKVCCMFFALCAVLSGAGMARGQMTRSPFRKASDRIAMDFRVGAMWPGQPATFTGVRTRTALGMSFAPYLGQGKVSHRFSIPIAFDYIPVSTYEYFDPSLASDARFLEQYLVINPSLGFDLVQTNRVDLTAHFGGAIVGNLTTFELPDIYGGWEDVCYIDTFDSHCPTKWNYLGNGGLSLRVFPKEGFPVYFGVDYTRYAGLKNQVVGTLGIAF